MEYTVILHRAEEGGYWVEVPALPGCFSQGETVEEALEKVREAIESHLLALKEDRQKIPRDEGILLGRVEVAIS
ncbi:MAG: type II toxin-antitoxin system HicB family antitoxin [Candidatus Bipolaricaulota bacterium]|nr:type II toxin-antitoxin system HicB family antitoxin [Candidatus Bipolaricaulota bacterium]